MSPDVWTVLVHPDFPRVNERWVLAPLSLDWGLNALCLAAGRNLAAERAALVAEKVSQGYLELTFAQGPTDAEARPGVQ